MEKLVPSELVEQNVKEGELYEKLTYSVRNTAQRIFLHQPEKDGIPIILSRQALSSEDRLFFSGQMVYASKQRQVQQLREAQGKMQTGTCLIKQHNTATLEGYYMPWSKAEQGLGNVLRTGLTEDQLNEYYFKDAEIQKQVATANMELCLYKMDKCHIPIATYRPIEESIPENHILLRTIDKEYYHWLQQSPDLYTKTGKLIPRETYFSPLTLVVLDADTDKKIPLRLSGEQRKDIIQDASSISGPSLLTVAGNISLTMPASEWLKVLLDNAVSFVDIIRPPEKSSRFLGYSIFQKTLEDVILRLKWCALNSEYDDKKFESEIKAAQTKVHNILNLPTKNGNTMLHGMVEAEPLDVCKILVILRYGGDLGCKNDAQQTPLQLLIERRKNAKGKHKVTERESIDAVLQKIDEFLKQKLRCGSK